MILDINDYHWTKKIQKKSHFITVSVSTLTVVMIQIYACCES